ncbi:MAG: UvrD-helicase domain-containing protein [Pseudomonadota bacterium]
MTVDFNKQDAKALDLNTIDSINRERALEHASFIVEAPAGAGKTELLTQRYLKLLASVNEPEEIIALTFTNKAAAEMRNRILLSLEHAQNQTPETAAHKLKTRALANAALDQSNAKQWDILSQPSRLRILTIDALCSSLTRQMPLLSKFGGQPAVSDDAETHYNDAARRAIAQIAYESDSDDTVTTALRYMDNNSEKLTDLLAKMLARRDQWLPMAGQLHGLDADEISYNTEVALAHLIAEGLQAALNILPESVQYALMPLARYAAGNLSAEADIAPLLDWELTLEADANDLMLWQALARFLLTQDKTYRKSINKNNGFPATDEGKGKKEDYFAIVNALGNSETLASVLALPAIATLADNQQVIHALTRLLILATTHLWAVFQAAGEVDFVAIAQSAQLALENEHGVTDLALKLDYKISHLLIDEFQDTSPVQMRLIEQLIDGWQPSDGRTLFCVGDPMQSIYRFRKADVSLFLQASKSGIGHLPLTRLQLSRNNRSHPAVVDWINTAFQQAFPGQDNINQGAISYRKFSATRQTVAHEGVVLHPLILEAAVSNGDAGNADTGNAGTEDDLETFNIKQVEAAYVADLIMNLREANPNKIAVLVRNRSHLTALVSEIRRNHPQLKFQAVEIEHLNDRQTVQDALSLVCAMHHRADRTHWLNILRAPWCGLTLQDLHALAADNHQATIWQLMHDEVRLQNLSEDGNVRLSHVKTILTAAFAAQGRVPTRRWLESTWLQLGGGKCLIDAGDNRDVQVFFDLVEKVSRSGHVDIAKLELGMQKLYAKPDIEADDSLQFLTIHKSKGLEFDTVILPALNRPPRHADNELVLWQEVVVDNHLRLIAAPFTPKVAKSSAKKNDAPNVYEYLKTLEKERADNELVRLLYVAATRTQRQLHLVASMQSNKNGEIKPVANSLLKVLWPAVEAEFSNAELLELNDSALQTLDITQFKPQLQRLHTAELNNSVLDEIVQNAVKTSSNLANRIVPFNGNEDTSITSLEQQQGKPDVPDLHRHCGTLAHIYMQLFAMTNLHTWHAERLRQCQPAMQKWLLQQGHTIKNAQQGAVQVLAALQTTLNSEAGQWVLKNHENAASELSLMQAGEAGVTNHIVDRTFIENGRRWIVDYKLTHFADSLDSQTDVELAAEQHRPQLERYAGLFTDEKLPIKTAVLFLNLGRLVEL